MVNNISVHMVYLKVNLTFRSIISKKMCYSIIVAIQVFVQRTKDHWSASLIRKLVIVDII